MPTTSVKDGSSWKPVTSIYYKQNGVWVPVVASYTKVAGVWVETFAAAVTATISATTTNLNLSSLFSLADWQNEIKKKIVIIPSGVIVGSTNPSLVALTTGTTMRGVLELQISGEVRGAGGAANSGVGGTAIKNDLNAGQLTIRINSGGAVRAGGGGGGRGGTGGSGTAAGTLREPASGENYSNENGGKYWWRRFSSESGGFTGEIAWANLIVDSGIDNNIVSLYRGGYTYYRGSLRLSSDANYYGVYRTSPTVFATAGGTGGAGGVGQGYNQALQLGSGGGAGGTNAGNGGLGGAGGSWGAAGGAGGTGASGNAGGGSAGSAGGAAGRSIAGNAHTLVNNGTLNGTILTAPN
jgi:hypothetical protein